MARASTVTWLPLDRWAQLVGLNPLHFNGLNSSYVKSEYCGSLWFQYDWQNSDRVSRDQVAQAIQQAEFMLVDYLGYFLRPDWVSLERVRPTRSARPELTAWGWNTQGLLPTVETERGYLISGGVKTVAELRLGVAYVDTDEDADGYPETCTVILSKVDVGDIDPCEIHAYFPGMEGDETYEIRPITVKESTTEYTVTLKKWLLVEPNLWEGFQAGGIDGDDDTNYIRTIDFYRIYNDPGTQLDLVWMASSACGCGSDSCAVCNISVQNGCLGIKDNRLGIVTFYPGTWDETSQTYSRSAPLSSRLPDYLRLSYYSGWQAPRELCQGVKLDPFWETAIVALAATFFERPVCDCTNVEGVIEQWREDLSTFTPDEGRMPSLATLSNPFGTYRGAVFAWNRCNQPGRRLVR